MIVAGIDYSLNSPAIAVYDTNKEFIFSNILLFNICKIKKYSGIFGNMNIVMPNIYTCDEERYLNNAKWSLDILTKYKVEKVVVEGYSMGSNSGLIIQIAENGSVLKQGLYLADIKYDNPSPKSVKKSFSGSGNAKKDEMVNQFVSRFGINISDIINQSNPYASPTNDLVDAIAMLDWGIKNNIFGE